MCPSCLSLGIENRVPHCEDEEVTWFCFVSDHFASFVLSVWLFTFGRRNCVLNAAMKNNWVHNIQH